MKFYSDIDANLGVWNGQNQKMMEFTDGVYETENKTEIEILQKCGYRYDADEVDETDEEALEELTNKELKDMLDDKGITYDKRANKAALLKLLEGAE